MLVNACKIYELRFYLDRILNAFSKSVRNKKKKIISTKQSFTVPSSSIVGLLLQTFMEICEFNKNRNNDNAG